MLKTHIYLLQFLGIIMLLCCYLLRDQPDRLSAMHFDPASKSVIKADRPDEVDYLAKEKTTTAASQQGHKQKINQTKYISFELMLPAIYSSFIFEAMQPMAHTCALSDNYSYLFYAEINPPPPKC